MATKVSIGDLFVVPLTDGRFALGKVLWRGKSAYFRGDLQVGIYSCVSSAEVDGASTQRAKPIALYYLVAGALERPSRPGWRIIGREKLEAHECGLTRRIHGGDVYFEDKYVGPASKEDYRTLPGGGSQLPCPIEARVNQLFDLTPDAKTVPKQINDSAKQNSISFPWTEAIEWTAALGRATSWKPIEKTLSAVVKAKYAEMDECHEAIAAGEVVAAARGQSAKTLPPDIKQWVAKHQSKFDESLVALAIQAVERVHTNSELQEEWDESDSLTDWKKQVSDLLKRLKK